MAFHIKDNMFIKDTPHGSMKAVRVSVKLNAGEHWYDTVDNEQPVKKLKAEGLDVIAGVAGISTFKPDTIVDSEGRRVGNPQILMENGTTIAVNIKVYAIGRGPTGNMRCVDLSFFYAIQQYMTNELLKKYLNVTMKKGKGSTPNPKKWGAIVAADDSVARFTHSLRIPLAIPGSCLEVDLTDPEVMVIIQKFQEEIATVDRSALTMANRNAIRKLLGISTVNDDGTVEVVSWSQVDFDHREVAKALESARDDHVVLGDEVIEVEREISTPDESDFITEDEIAEDVVDEEPEMTVKEAIVKARELVKTRCKPPYDSDPLLTKALAACGMASAQGIGACDDIKVLMKLISSLES